MTQMRLSGSCGACFIIIIINTRSCQLTKCTPPPPALPFAGIPGSSSASPRCLCSPPAARCCWWSSTRLCGRRSRSCRPPTGGSSPPPWAPRPCPPRSSWTPPSLWGGGSTLMFFIHYILLRRCQNHLAVTLLPRWVTRRPTNEILRL